MLDELLHHRHMPYSMLIDIGSGSVGAAIVEEDGEEKKPLIIYAYRENIRVTRKKTPEEFVRILKEALLAATLEIASAGMRALQSHDTRGRIGRIEVMYASPWSEVITRIIAVEHKEPFKVTDAFVASLIDEALKQADSENHERAIFEATGQIVIHRAVIKSEINGYPVTHFTNQEGTELRIAYMTELVPTLVRETLLASEKNLAAHATREERTFVTAAYTASRAIYPDITSALLLEITGEAIECGIIENSVLYENFSTLFGSHSLYRLVAEKLDTLESEAKSHIREYIAQTARDDVREVVMIARETFKGYLRKVFDAAQSEYVLPEHIVLVLDAETAPFFAEMIDETYAGYRSEHVMHHLDEPAVAKLVDYTDGCVHDHYLAIGAFFFHTEHKKDI